MWIQRPATLTFSPSIQSFLWVVDVGKGVNSSLLLLLLIYNLSIRPLFEVVFLSDRQVSIFLSNGFGGCRTHQFLFFFPKKERKIYWNLPPVVKMPGHDGTQSRRPNDQLPLTSKGEEIYTLHPGLYFMHQFTHFGWEIKNLLQFAFPHVRAEYMEQIESHCAD